MVGKSMFKRFIEDETGATAIEYGLIASFFAVLIVSAFGTLRVEYVRMFGVIETTMTDAVSP